MSNTHLVPVVLSSGHTIYHLSKDEHVDTNLGIHLVGENDLIVYWNGVGDACPHLWDRIRFHSERCKSRGIMVRPPSKGQLVCGAKDSNVLIPVEKTIFHLTFSDTTELLKMAKGLPLALFNCADKRCDESTSIDMRYGYFCVKKRTSNQWFRYLGNEKLTEVHGFTTIEWMNQHKVGDPIARNTMVATIDTAEPPGPDQYPKSTNPVTLRHTPGSMASRVVTALNKSSTAKQHTIPLTLGAPYLPLQAPETLNRVPSNQLSDHILAPTPAVAVGVPLRVHAPGISVRAATTVSTSIPSQVSPNTTATFNHAGPSHRGHIYTLHERLAVVQASRPAIAEAPKINGKDTSKLDRQSSAYSVSKKQDNKQGSTSRRTPKGTARLMSCVDKRVLLSGVRYYKHKSERGCYDISGEILVAARTAYTLEAAKMRGKTQLEAMLKEVGYEKKGYNRLTQDLGEQIVNLL